MRSLKSIVASKKAWSTVSLVDSDFSWLPFAIQRKNRTFRPDPTWSISANRPTGKAYYVATDGNDANSGLDADHPLRKINTAIGKADVVEVYIKAGLYGDVNGLWSGAITKNISIMSYGGRAILGSCRENLSWSRQASPNDLVFGATCGTMQTVIDFGNLTSTGDASKLTSVADVATVQATPGSYVRLSGVLYVRTLDDRTPDTNLRTVSGGVNLVQGGYTVYYENIDFEGGGSALAAAGPLSPTVYANNCTWKYAYAGNAYNVQGGTFYAKDCLFARAYQDGANYGVGSTAITRAVEINCIGRDNGSANSHINQGSTSHTGSLVVRIGCEYMRNDAPGVVDIDATTKSWLLGCYSHDSTITTTSNYATGTASGQKMWLDRCNSSGGQYDLTCNSGTNVYIRQFVGTATNNGSGTANIVEY